MPQSSNEQLSVTVSDGTFHCHVARPAGPGQHPVVVILQEIFGVNAGIRAIAADYAAKGYVAVAPDLFWRSEPGLSLSEADAGAWEKGLSLYSAFDIERGVQDIGAAIAAARRLPGTSGKVGVTGYCLGGLLTFLAAARTDGDAFVAYYGGATERWLDEAARIKAPLLYHVAGLDEYMPGDAQAAIRASLSGVPGAEVYTYAERAHAFARPNGRHYHAGDATLANGRTDAFLARHLRE